MSREEAHLSLSRHATSKIRDAEDLLHVGTLGFRGEALPSIASVSRFTLLTGNVDGLRTRLEIEGGESRPAESEAGPRGTEIIIEDLFFNVPARRKFLKSDTTELGQSLDHLSRYAFAYPHVAFKVTHNGQVAMETPGRDDRL
jgi:DNA mismatch repair protein MutL